MKHSKFTKILAVLMAVALLIPGGALFASAECDHDFSVQEIVAEATCTTDRVSHYRCSKCDAVEKNSSGDPIDYHSGKTLHDLIYYLEADDDAYYTSRTAPTCVDAGYTDYCCAICDKVIWTLNADPLGHNGVWIIEQEATEDHDGVAAERCTRCGETLDTDSFSQHLHVYDDGYRTGYKRILTPATCTVDGEMGVFCAICGALFDVETIDPTGHSNAQLADYMTSLNDLEDYIGYTNVVTTMPTCTKDGVISFLCDECGEVVRSYPLDKIGHHNACWDEMTDGGYDPEDYIGCANVETTPATCTEDGEIRFLCDDCGIVIYTEKLEATGHYNEQLAWYLTDLDATLEDVLGFTNVVVTTEPTCTKKGVVTFMCDVCGEAMRSYPLDKLDHTEGYKKEIKAATCMNAGEMGVYCANCGELYDTIPIEALGHDYGEWTPNGDKTHSRSCSRCTFTDKATCKFNATVTPPTCTEGGYTTYVCADCGFTYVDDYTDALGHDWSEWIDDANGETHTRTCARCGETETEEHCFGEWVYNHDAKFFKNGTKSMTCDVCGCVITEKAQFTAWIWHLFYPIMLWVGTIVHKTLFLGSLTWFLPWLNIQPKM